MRGRGVIGCVPRSQDRRTRSLLRGGTRWISADLEAHQPLGRALPHLDVTDARAGRTMSTEGDDRLHIGCPALEQDLDAAVRAVDRPAGHATVLGLLLDPRAKEDALDASAEAQAACDLLIAHGRPASTVGVLRTVAVLPLSDDEKGQRYESYAGEADEDDAGDRDRDVPAGEQQRDTRDQGQERKGEDARVDPAIAAVRHVAHAPAPRARS